MSMNPICRDIKCTPTLHTIGFVGLDVVLIFGVLTLREAFVALVQWL